MIPENIDLDIEKIKHIFCNLRDGVALADAQSIGFPLIYTNIAFEKISGYKFEEIKGLNCNFLQGEGTNDTDITQIRNALKNQECVLVTILNYRKNGEPFWNELSISPLKDKYDNVKYFMSIQKDVTEKVLFDIDMTRKLEHLSIECKEIGEKANTDSLTKLFNRGYFDLQFPLQLRIARRHNISVSVFMIDVDYFKQFNDTYGHIEGDECLREISKTLQSCFSRSTDICARFGGEEFVIIALGLSNSESLDGSKILLEKIRELNITHEKSEYNRVTVSIGLVHSADNKDGDCKALLKYADDALYQAKNKGRDCMIRAECI